MSHKPKVCQNPTCRALFSRGSKEELLRWKTRAYCSRICYFEHYRAIRLARFAQWSTWKESHGTRCNAE